MGQDSLLEVVVMTRGYAQTPCADSVVAACDFHTCGRTIYSPRVCVTCEPRNQRVLTRRIWGGNPRVVGQWRKCAVHQYVPLMADEAGNQRGMATLVKDLGWMKDSAAQIPCVETSRA
jgi:hypothetical protein